MKEEIKTCEERVKKLLEMTPPKEKEFLHSIEHILERERNWVWWKRDGCPPFEKSPTEKKLGQDSGRKCPPKLQKPKSLLETPRHVSYSIWRNVDAGTRGANKTNEGY